MALSDKLETTPPQGMTGSPCSVGALLDQLPDTERAALHSMMYELGWSGARIWKALTDEGHIVGRQTINRHRSQACRCFSGEAA